MNKIYGNKVVEFDRVILRPVMCADGLWRWAAISFEDIDENTPAFVAHPDLNIFENSTDKTENPENYGEENE